VAASAVVAVGSDGVVAPLKSTDPPIFCAFALRVAVIVLVPETPVAYQISVRESPEFVALAAAILVSGVAPKVTELPVIPESSESPTTRTLLVPAATACDHDSEAVFPVALPVPPLVTAMSLLYSCLVDGVFSEAAKF
jgi:hypothetical protein